MGRRCSGQFRETGDEFRPETAQVSFRGNFITELFGQVGSNRVIDRVQHAFVPGIVLVEDHHLKQMKILNRQQKLCLQIIILVSEQEIGMENKRIESTVLVIHGADRMHDILIDDDALSRIQGVGDVVTGDFGVTVVDDQDLHLFMPVPANPVHVGFAQVEIVDADGIIQSSETVLYIIIVICFNRGFLRRCIRG